ncbi:hypothetical protein [Cellulomonas sp. GbtcB1]|uniref:hypothetical protein n=1 Tax=Cellulomonas sp. GbtcB1 TaxID=2824746 RepID=UPI001C2F1A17|nr:hypothetical protein [Cellulomonas sp. GbtcB1]
MIALADGRAQSPGETLLRWSLHSGGLPPPELQVEVVTRRGRFFLDLGWPVPRVAVEDALEEEGWRVLRVTWDDLRAPAPLVARVARALSRSSR